MRLSMLRVRVLQSILSQTSGQEGVWFMNILTSGVIGGIRLNLWD